MSRARVFVALMIACVALTPSARAGGPASESDDLHQVLLYAGGESPIFIPERVLQERSPEEVLTTWGAGTFRNHVQAQRSPHLYMKLGRTNYPLCEQIEEPATEGGSIELSMLHELIDGVTMALIAKVTAVTPGWSAETRGVAELAKLEVQEILDNHAELPQEVGGTVRVITPGGRLRYEEVVLCEEPETSWHRPAVGERVLVLGVPFESVPSGYFSDLLIFELRGGDVILQAGIPSGATMRSVPLSQVAVNIRYDGDRIEQRGSTASLAIK